MPARGTESKSEGAARPHLFALGEALQDQLNEVGQAPTGFVRNSKYPVGISHQTLNALAKHRNQDVYVPTLVRLGLAFRMAGCDIDPFYFLRVVAQESYKQVAPEYEYDGNGIVLEVETPDVIGTPGMPMQVVRDYQDLTAVERGKAAHELMKAIARDFAFLGGDRLQQISCLVTEAVERKPSRKLFAESVDIRESTIRAIVLGAWNKVSLTDVEVMTLATKVYDPNGRLGNGDFFEPLIAPTHYRASLDPAGVDLSDLKSGAN